jgi:hypothetical protein
MYVEILQPDVGRGTDAFEPPSYDVECVFGSMEQHAPRMWHREVSQTRGAGSHGNG